MDNIFDLITRASNGNPYTGDELREHCEKQIETVSKESYDHEYFLRKELEMKIAKLEQDKNKVLDKLRAEILKISSYEGFELGGVKDGYRIAMVNVLEIIDKHKAETESNEDRNE